MKSLALLFFVAFVAWSDAKVDHVPSYLRHVGSYSESEIASKGYCVY